MKFGKTFRLTIQVDGAGETVVIEYPLTIDFQIVRTMFSGANTGRFTIYNLSETTRNKIFHDRYDIYSYRGIVLEAGYQGQNPLPIIFKGNIQVAYSHRDRADWLTEINCFDGGLGMMTSQSSTAIPAGVSVGEAIRRLMPDLKNIVSGAVSTFAVKSERGTSLSGNTWTLVDEIANNNGGMAFVDNETAHVLKPNDYVANLPGSGNTISGGTGLLRAQMMFKNRVDVDVVFDPTRALGQLVRLESEESRNDGDYIVKGLSHRGTISGAVDSPCVTTLNLDKSTGVPTGILK
jgi:hypothetical protein